MVYDLADRLILSQDGNQRAKKQQDKKQWTATKYDDLGRIIFTGTTYVDSTKTVQSLNTDYSTQLITENYTVGTGYSNQFFADASPLTINYYDGYDFIDLLTVDTDKSTLPFVALDGYDGQFSSAKGLLTGNRIYHLNDPAKFEATALYYDKYGRVVQSRASNHLGGYDLVYNALDFLGKPTKTYKTHGINGALDTYTELYSYTYDKAQRMLTTTYSLNGGGAVTLASNTYDELGRLTTKKRHANADTETYAYNVRNWATSITSGGFTENLYYNANPLNSNVTYNGNISYSTWTYNGATKGYLYDYDGLNRLLSANFKQGSSGLGDDSFNENFTYDKMGNILTLKRKKNYTLIDDLVFHYSNNEKSNQLQYVDDGGATQSQYLIKEYQNKSNTQAEFEYDANGNMKKDLDRDIATIQYNMLNLPDVVQFKNGNQIKNTYNAGGQKLGTEYFTWRPGANAPVVNTGDVLTISYSQGAIDQNGTAYIGNMEYNTQNGNSSLTALNRIHNTEGYVENIPSPNYYYYRKDHLGNNREVWLANTNSTVQRTQYYPSGLPMASVLADSVGKQQLKYNGKEFVEMHGYDTYDYGWRGYYPALGYFTTRDPLAEKYYSISPYIYCHNNPINVIDPKGLTDIFRSNGTFLKSDGVDNGNILVQIGTKSYPLSSLDYNKQGTAHAVSNIIGHYASEMGYSGTYGIKGMNAGGHTTGKGSVFLSASEFKNGSYDNLYNIKSTLGHEAGPKGHKSESSNLRENYTFMAHAGVYFEQGRTSDFTKSDLNEQYTVGLAFTERVWTALVNNEINSHEFETYIKAFNDKNTGGVFINYNKDYPKTGELNINITVDGKSPNGTESVKIIDQPQN
jgi:RHS repeat-associated protein